MDRNANIYVAGHRGLVGSAIVRELHNAGMQNVITRGRDELDLTDRTAVDAVFSDVGPDYVFLAAARVGGILANIEYPADFIRENLLIQINVIDAAFRAGTRKLLFLGSSCIYPKNAAQPLKEEYLLTGALEPTNDAYAIAKIAGIKLCQAYREQHGFDAMCAMPANLYGPNDNFDLSDSHVLPALIRKIHEAKFSGPPSAQIWGTGSPKREFLHVDDLAAACVYLMSQPSDAFYKVAPDGVINIGSGKEISIRHLAEMISEVVGFHGEFEFDETKPDGTPRKRLDLERSNALGWKAKIALRQGIEQTYGWFLRNVSENGGAQTHLQERV